MTKWPITFRPKRTWQGPTPFDIAIDHLSKAIAQGLRDGAPLHVIRSAMEHCHKYMVWDQQQPDVPPVMPDRLRIINPPGTQQRLPLEHDDDLDREKTAAMLAAGYKTWHNEEAS